MRNKKDFTLKKYEQLCEAISTSRYSNMTIKEYFENKEKADSVILIRHDIDENVRFALDIAEVEAKFGIKATYYFRTKKKVFVPEIIDQIASYHHEIGYHYETLDEANGDMDFAIHLFSKELSMFRDRYDVRTVCMHGNPLSKFDNRNIWKKCNLTDFDILGEPYISLDYDKIAYFSDSGRTWNINKNKIKDTVEKARFHSCLHNTDDLIKLIDTSELSNICILTHPERWPRTYRDYCYRYCVDLTYNLGKWFIIKTQKES